MENQIQDTSTLKNPTQVARESDNPALTSLARFQASQDEEMLEGRPVVADRRTVFRWARKGHRTMGVTRNSPLRGLNV